RSSAVHLLPHSFPTRRSSDLLPALRNLLQPLAVADNDETHRLRVLAAPCHPPGLQDALKHLIRDRLVRVGPRIALCDNYLVCVHLAPGLCYVTRCTESLGSYLLQYPATTRQLQAHDRPRRIHPLHRRDRAPVGPG